MNTTDIIGIIASIFTGIALLPQLLKIAREKSAKGTSWLMLISIFIGVTFWTIYGIKKDDWIIIISNGFAWIINVTVITLSLIYQQRDRDKSAVKA